VGGLLNGCRKKGMRKNGRIEIWIRKATIDYDA